MDTEIVDYIEKHGLVRIGELCQRVQTYLAMGGQHPKLDLRGVYSIAKAMKWL